MKSVLRRGGMAAFFCVGLACSGMLDPTAYAPEPPPHTDFVGTWEGPGLHVEISEEGLVHILHQDGTQITITGQAKNWQPGSVSVGLGPLSQQWSIPEAPYEVDGEWRMVFDDVMVVRTSTETPSLPEWEPPTETPGGPAAPAMPAAEDPAVDVNDAIAPEARPPSP